MHEKEKRKRSWRNRRHHPEKVREARTGNDPELPQDNVTSSPVHARGCYGGKKQACHQTKSCFGDTAFDSVFRVLK